ncbi:MAG TPA: MipA/OmpV family protein [Sphingomicrobium sp.]|nr:MipA/OmpV family protein [Sphingomicrobium sp.]
MVRLLLAAAALSMTAPAFAQPSEPALPDPNDQSDTFTIGVGAALVPDYEGSDDYRLIPAAAVRGRVSGISFFSRGTYLYVDLIKRGAGQIEFDAGPIAGVRFNRTGKIKDDRVDRLPERDKAIELGGFAGVTAHGLTNPYDALSFRVDVVKDVSNAHDSMVVTPSIDFGTPLSRSFYVGASLSAEWVGGGYADYYYSVTLLDGFTAGLRPYDADGGYKGWKLGLLGNYAFSGDLTRGMSLFATGSYGRLSGDFKRSPIVADRGSPNQWLAATGLAYTF